MNGIPLAYLLAALWQWLILFPLLFGGVLLTYFPMGFLVALTSRAYSPHPQGKPLTATHDADYLAEGSSGWWEYWNSPVRWLRPWNNYEDGTLCEPSGKGSARVGGNERSVWNQYLWICRNAFNWAKRSSQLLACYVNDCTVDYWGSYTITDKAPVVEGWYFVRATHKVTGRVYYGFRLVRLRSDGRVFQINLGFKIKPEHARTVQDPDDLDKALTYRIQFAAEAD